MNYEIHKERVWGNKNQLKKLGVKVNLSTKAKRIIPKLDLCLKVSLYT